jgi:hypothetical protein
MRKVLFSSRWRQEYLLIALPAVALRAMAGTARLRGIYPELVEGIAQWHLSEFTY